MDILDGMNDLDRARERIRRLLSQETLYPEQIAERLGISRMLASSLTAELARAGELEVVK